MKQFHKLSAPNSQMKDAVTNYFAQLQLVIFTVIFISVASKILPWLVRQFQMSQETKLINSFVLLYYFWNFWLLAFQIYYYICVRSKQILCCIHQMACSTVLDGRLRALITSGLYLCLLQQWCIELDVIFVTEWYGCGVWESVSILVWRQTASCLGIFDVICRHSPLGENPSPVCLSGCYVLQQFFSGKK